MPLLLEDITIDKLPIEVKLQDNGFYEASIENIDQTGALITFENRWRTDTHVPYEILRCVRRKSPSVEFCEGMEVDGLDFNSAGTSQGYWKGIIKEVKEGLFKVEFHNRPDKPVAELSTENVYLPNTNPLLKVENFYSYIIPVKPEDQDCIKYKGTLEVLQKTLGASMVSYNEESKNIVVTSPFEKCIKRAEILRYAFMRSALERYRIIQQLEKIKHKIETTRIGGFFDEIQVDPTLIGHALGREKYNLRMAKAVEGISFIKFKSELSSFIVFGESRQALQRVRQILEYVRDHIYVPQNLVPKILGDKFQFIKSVTQSHQLGKIFVPDKFPYHGILEKENEKVLVLIGVKENVMNAKHFLEFHLNHLKEIEELKEKSTQIRNQIAEVCEETIINVTGESVKEIEELKEKSTQTSNQIVEVCEETSINVTCKSVKEIEELKEEITQISTQIVEVCEETSTNVTGESVKEIEELKEESTQISTQIVEVCEETSINVTGESVKPIDLEHASIREFVEELLRADSENDSETVIAGSECETGSELDGSEINDIEEDAKSEEDKDKNNDVAMTALEVVDSEIKAPMTSEVETSQTNVQETITEEIVVEKINTHNVDLETDISVSKDVLVETPEDIVVEGKIMVQVSKSSIDNGDFHEQSLEDSSSHVSEEYHDSEFQHTVATSVDFDLDINTISKADCYSIFSQLETAVHQAYTLIQNARKRLISKRVSFSISSSLQGTGDLEEKIATSQSDSQYITYCKLQEQRSDSQENLSESVDNSTIPASTSSTSIASTEFQELMPGNDDKIPLHTWIEQIGYQGPLVENISLKFNLQKKNISMRLMELICYIAKELKTNYKLQETISLPKDENCDLFFVQLAEFLTELECPYLVLFKGNIRSRLQCQCRKKLLLKYLISELLCARLLKNQTLLSTMSQYLIKSKQQIDPNMLLKTLNVPCYPSKKTVILLICHLNPTQFIEETSATVKKFKEVQIFQTGSDDILTTVEKWQERQHILSLKQIARVESHTTDTDEELERTPRKTTIKTPESCKSNKKDTSGDNASVLKTAQAIIDHLIKRSMKSPTHNIEHTDKAENHSSADEGDDEHDTEDDFNVEQSSRVLPEQPSQTEETTNASSAGDIETNDSLL